VGTPTPDGCPPWVLVGMILVFKLLHRHFAGRKVATRDTVPFAYQGSSSDPTSDGTFTYGRTPSGGLVSISDGSDGLLAGLDRHRDLTHLHTPEGTVTDTSRGASFRPVPRSGSRGADLRDGADNRVQLIPPASEAGLGDPGPSIT
jgi:hypothetical protein